MVSSGYVGRENGEVVNQIKLAQDMLINEPTSRRIIVSGWNVADLQELVKGKPRLLLVTLCFSFMWLREAFLPTLPKECRCFSRRAFNIASYALLTMMFANVAHLKLGEFIHPWRCAYIITTSPKSRKFFLARQDYHLNENKKRC